MRILWTIIAPLLETILIGLRWWWSNKKKKEEDERLQQGRKDIVDGDVDAVSARLDRLLTKARDRAERGKDS